MHIQKYARTVLLLVWVLLFVSGCKSIYVDANNVAGPWDGSRENPFRTISEAIDAAREDSDHNVKVKGLTYRENIILKRGVDLIPWPDDTSAPLIRGSEGRATIRARGNQIIRGFGIEGGSEAVRIELEGALNRTDRPYMYIQDCEIREGIRGGAVRFETPDDLTFSEETEKRIDLEFKHNYIHDFDGDAIHIDLTGPVSGSLHISLDIRGNVIEQTLSAISLNAAGQGEDPTGNRAVITGNITNNLIFDNNGHGIQLHGRNRGDASPLISFNTLDGNDFSAIIASAESGPDGGSGIHASILSNIISNNGGAGYEEFSLGTSPFELSHNLFYANSGGHYADEETLRILTSEEELNTPIVDRRVVFGSGSGNLVGNPLFESGEFWWMNIGIVSGPADFFLRQNGTVSPAVDAAGLQATDVQMQNRTTRTDAAPDSGTADIGFHYRIH